MSEVDITLAHRSEALNFQRGLTYTWTAGSWSRRRWHTRTLSRLWARLTWWRQPRGMCVVVDIRRGIVTVVSMRWSWRRWRWIRQDGQR